MSKKQSSLFISDQRMLELMEFSVVNKYAESQRDWCSRIGFNPTNISQIRTGRQGFTDEQKLAAAELVNANMNWLYGLEKNMTRVTKERSALDLIKEGVRMLERK